MSRAVEAVRILTYLKDKPVEKRLGEGLLVISVIRRLRQEDRKVEVT